MHICGARKLHFKREIVSTELAAEHNPCLYALGTTLMTTVLSQSFKARLKPGFNWKYFFGILSCEWSLIWNNQGFSSWFSTFRLRDIVAMSVLMQCVWLSISYETFRSLNRACLWHLLTEKHRWHPPTVICSPLGSCFCRHQTRAQKPSISKRLETLLSYFSPGLLLTVPDQKLKGMLLTPPPVTPNLPKQKSASPCVGSPSAVSPHKQQTPQWGLQKPAAAWVSRSTSPPVPPRLQLPHSTLLPMPDTPLELPPAPHPCTWPSALPPSPTYLIPPLYSSPPI